MALTTAALVRYYIPALTGNASDTELDILIARFDALAARFCGFPANTASVNPTLEDVEYRLYVDGPGGRVLRSPIHPLVSVTSIYDDPLMTYGADTLVAATDYDGLSRLPAGIITLDADAVHGAWSEAEDAIKLTVVAGYETIPQDIVEACCQWVANKWMHRGLHGESSVAYNELNVSLTDKNDSLTPAVKAILAPHRNMTALMLGL